MSPSSANQRIIYENVAGDVSVIIPTGEVPIEELPAKLGLTDYEIIQAAAIPVDRTFRNAWRISNKRVEVDIPKAREIAHALRRQMRADALRPLDEVIMKQIPGTDLQAAEAQRQAIRDNDAKVQAAIDYATSTDALLAAISLSKKGPGR